MILLGLIIVLLAIAAGGLLYLATQNLTDPIDLSAGGYQVGATPLALLIAGAVVMLLLWLGLALIRGSLRRKTRRRREAKEAQRQAEHEERIREDERSRMAAAAPTPAQRFAGPGVAAAGAASAASAAGVPDTDRSTSRWEDASRGRRDDAVTREPHDAPSRAGDTVYASNQAASGSERPDMGASHDEPVDDRTADRTQVLGGDTSARGGTPTDQGGRHEAPAGERAADRPRADEARADWPAGDDSAQASSDTAVYASESRAENSAEESARTAESDTISERDRTAGREDDSQDTGSKPTVADKIMGRTPPRSS